MSHYQPLNVVCRDGLCYCKNHMKHVKTRCEAKHLLCEISHRLQRVISDFRHGVSEKHEDVKI